MPIHLPEPIQEDLVLLTPITESDAENIAAIGDVEGFTELVGSGIPIPPDRIKYEAARGIDGWQITYRVLANLPRKVHLGFAVRLASDGRMVAWLALSASTADRSASLSFIGLRRLSEVMVMPRRH
jgi:hypothetical protein